MNEGRFSAEDLEPSPEDRRAERLGLVDRAAATVAVIVTGVWMGGMIALGACAAPFVFRMTPGPFSGDAMGAAFARFDQIAIGCGVVLLGAEVARTFVAGRRANTKPARARRIAAIFMAVGALWGGLALTPAINALHRAGVRRGDGPEGEKLDAIHHRAEAIGKAEIALGVIVIALHVFTLGARRPDDDDDAPAPLPPGPR